MKISITICEYNPLHLGHIRQINFIKENIKPDIIAVILSGNFVERGEPSICDKYTRALWAINAGADIVFELPTVFATGNAEVFSKGALKLANSLPGEKVLCFGTETDNASSLIEIAKAMLVETEEYKKQLKLELKEGLPFAKARHNALLKTHPELDLTPLSTPNNILGVEYIKAILQNDYDISIKTIKRDSDYNESKIIKKSPSALSIRTAILSGKKYKCKGSVPKYVYKDLPTKLPDFSREIIYSLLKSTKEELKRLPDLSEGLENKIKALVKDNFNLGGLISKLKTKRYTETRLKRILISSLLGIEESFVKKCLNDDLYLKVLAVNKDRTDILSTLSKAKYPLITRKSNYSTLSGTALECFNKDIFSSDIYSSVTGTKTNEFEMKIK
ncbi:MAG: nucleotidyltransferase family protein [Clostridia bacterium]|nr:nucleotidyltransferase family protein [Clostridia bacterium]